MLIEVDRTKIEERMAFTRENYRMVREELLKILYWMLENAAPSVPKPLARDRIEAAKNVVMIGWHLGSWEENEITVEWRLRAENAKIYKRPGIAAWARGGCC